MEQGGALNPLLFTLRRIAYSIKEDRNDMATWNSRGLRGSTLEDMINKTNEKYRENGLALIQKIPTPITPIKMEPETRHITLFTNKQKTNNTLLIYALLKYLIEILKSLAAAIRVYYLNPLCLKPRQSKRHGYAMIVIRFNFTRLNTLCRINP